MRTERPAKLFVPLRGLGWGCARKTSLGAQLFITDRSRAVTLLWFYVACFGVRISLTFRLTCVHIILVQFRLLSGRLLGNGCSLG